MLWIYYYEDEKVNKSVDQKEKNCLYRCMSTWATWVFMTSGAYYSLIRRPKRKHHFFSGRYQLQVAGINFSKSKQCPPSYQYDLYPASLSVCALFTTS